MSALAVAFVALVLAPVSAHAASRFVAPGDHDLALGARTFVMHLPPNFAGRGPLPLVVAFHGGGGHGPGFKAYAGLDRVADREGFVVVYPDGSGRMARRLLTWNAGGCCGYAALENVDDVGFTLALLRDLARDLPLDPTRVYATGHSNGSMMAYRMAAESAERIAAIVAVAGVMPLLRFTPSRPMPVLHVHSVDDPRALYTGGLGPPFPGTQSRVAHGAVEPQLERWRIHDRCPAEPRTADRRAAGGHTATLSVWAPCADGAEVALWKLTGAGHAWPGSRSPLPERIMGPDTTVIDAAEEAWRFLARFRRADAPALR